MAISGLKNRYSTFRGNSAPFKEVFFQTYDPSGVNQVDYSEPIAFGQELKPGTVALDISSLQVTKTKVGQQTEFTFTLDLPGLVTKPNDNILIKFGQIEDNSDSGKLFSYLPDNGLEKS